MTVHKLPQAASIGLHVDYQYVFEKLPTAAAVLHRRVIVACNEKFCSMLKTERNQLIGTTFEILYAVPTDFDLRGEKVGAILKKKGTYADDWLMKRFNDEVFWCHISGFAFDRKDPFERAAWTFSDLTIERQVSSSVGSSLTQREREVAIFLMEGHSSKEIARRLSISPRTVDIHRCSLLEKYGVSKTADLVTALTSI
jgi:DNA-binding CsgD family transcriptional regulator